MGNKKMKIGSTNGLRLVGQVDRDIENNITFKDFFEIHEKFIGDKSLEGLASRTLEEHRTHLKYFKYFLEVAYRSKLNRVAEQKINYEVFKDYLSYMVIEKEYKPCTVNIRLRTLKCYLKWLYDNGYISEDIRKRMKLVKVPEDTIKPLTEYEIKKMLKACDVETYAGFRDYTIMLLMLDCGIRVGETVEVKITDVELKEGILTIRAENAKSRKMRQVPISKMVCKLLKELIKIAKENESEYIFQSTYGGKIDKENIILSFRRLSKRSGLRDTCTPHRFRHTFATNATRENMDIFTLQRIMGHSSINTTRKYVQLDYSDLKKKHDSINFINKYF